MKKELKVICFTIVYMLINNSVLYSQLMNYDSIKVNEYFILMDSTNQNFDIQYNKKGHPIKISMEVGREDLDWFKIIYDPINSTSLFNNGHTHVYKRKNEIVKLIDYNWLLKSKTAFKIVYKSNKHKVYFVERTEDERFWSVYETGIVIQTE